MPNIKVAAVGLGRWGKNVLRVSASVKNADLMAVCDSDSKELSKLPSQYPSVKIFQDYSSLLALDELDAVLLATPAPMHFAMAMEALDRGKHVYVEKPMTLTVQEAERLVARAEETNRILMVGHLLEYHPAVIQLKDLLDRGELGEIRYLYSKRLNLGVVRADENSLWSLAPHDISVILFLMGIEPLSVSATGLASIQSTVEDVVFVSLMFPQNRMAQIHVSWLDPHKERKLVIVGSEKMAVFDDMHPSEKIRIYDKSAMIAWSHGNTIEAISVRHGDILIPVVSNGTINEIADSNAINMDIHMTTDIESLMTG